MYKLFIIWTNFTKYIDINELSFLCECKLRIHFNNWDLESLEY